MNKKQGNGLNPYFNGKYFLRKACFENLVKRLSLNPYFNGKYFLRIINIFKI